MDVAGLQNAVLNSDKTSFNALALDVFQYQSRHCEVYRQYLEHLQIHPSNIDNIEDIPHLPIEFFKQFEVKTDAFLEDVVFESSSTSGQGISRHYVRDRTWYTKVFTKCFDVNFGGSEQYCHLALLPSYLERKHSSLVFQVGHFIQHSKYKQSAFFLNNQDVLFETLIQNEANQIPGILWGVSFALLDFVEKYKVQLKYTRVIETGGMKGRRKEITRNELHSILKEGFDSNQISGEYGMTELMSQAYADENGLYTAPEWMQISIREINDPFSRVHSGKHGAINIIDLANLNSCAFIATSDLGKIHDTNSFEILGRIDHSDTRGCNLLV